VGYRDGALRLHSPNKTENTFAGKTHGSVLMSAPGFVVASVCFALVYENVGDGGTNIWQSLPKCGSC
jgi:hypothetical protein